MSAIDCRRPCQFVFEPPSPDSPVDGNLLYIPPAVQPVTAPKTPVDESDCLLPFSELLTRQHGLCPDAATAISLAVLSAAIGPGRTLKNPLGGLVSVAFNVVVEDGHGARTQRAAFQTVLPFKQWVTRKIVAHQEKGNKHLRQTRMERELEYAQALHRLHYPPEKPRDPLTVPLPAEVRKKEALDAATDEAEKVAARCSYFEFEERPFLMIDGLSARDLPTLPQRAFDGALLNFSPYGDAIRHLETMRSQDRREVLRYLVAAWHGQPYLAGAGTIPSPVVTNLWLAAPGDTTKAWRNPAIAASGLPGTFLLVTNHDGPEPDGEASADAPAMENWHRLIEVVIGERIRGETAGYELSEPATERFLEFRTRTLVQQSADTSGPADWWPEQLLKITLLLHLATLRPEVPQQIDLTTMEAAIGVMERLGSAQVRALAATAAPAQDFDAQIELMVARVRVKGPMPKWKLYKGFHSHRAEVMEPLLARCFERNLLRMDNDLVQLADEAQ